MKCKIWRQSKKHDINHKTWRQSQNMTSITKHDTFVISLLSCYISSRRDLVSASFKYVYNFLIKFHDITIQNLIRRIQEIELPKRRVNLGMVTKYKWSLTAPPLGLRNFLLRECRDSDMLPIFTHFLLFYFGSFQCHLDVI